MNECVMDGFERFAQGHLITLFSATNYCGTANNAGAILVLGRDLVMVPKLIHPLPPAASGHQVMGLAPGESPMMDPWMREWRRHGLVFALMMTRAHDRTRCCNWCRT
eukprot:TRINITY_DN8107_c0_g1_i3.p3 TRINITY_DN8107_c0_g1~~TRINITY_DN8107_c0_g1_i3.p3  ORF type:complete len:116 (+),score=10.30 TRINITY_DN8107_c0_g1_i3:30-350(+)